MKTETLCTPLHGSHLEQGAKMCCFAGYDMPLHYNRGIVEEHLWARNHAGMFDVSHMGVISIKGAKAIELLETLTPSAYHKMQNMASRYTVLMNSSGGIVDDLIVTKINPEDFLLVVNASRKNIDLEHICSIAKTQFDNIDIALMPKAIIALQGPQAESSLAQLLALDLSGIKYMNATSARYLETEILLNRVGYTGEDGFEIILQEDVSRNFWQDLLKNPEVKPVGLAARDSLRLEMGYPLYGSDLNDSISPIEGSLDWLIGANQLFLGHERVLQEKAHSAKHKRVGVVLQGKGVLRPGMLLTNESGESVGKLSSGGYSPILGKSIGMAYIANPFTGKTLTTQLHGKAAIVEITDMPFIQPKVRK